MTKLSRNFAGFAALASSLLPVTAAQAQYYAGTQQPPPLYPYVMQNSNGVQTAQPYAVQVAPNTYVIQRPAPPRNYPYVRGIHVNKAAPAAKARRFDRPHKPVDRVLIEELRQRSKAKQDAKRDEADRLQYSRAVINTTKIVRDPPIVVETQRVVDDPPRVIERHVVADEPVRSRGIINTNRSTSRDAGESRDDTKQRVIEADAEVTILGPDRMSIRLFRKGHSAKAGSRAN
jgi:hypothetical protein